MIRGPQEAGEAAAAKQYTPQSALSSLQLLLKQCGSQFLLSTNALGVTEPLWGPASTSGPSLFCHLPTQRIGRRCARTLGGRASNLLFLGTCMHIVQAASLKEAAGMTKQFSRQFII